MNTMHQYYDLIRKVITEGNIRTDRTNTGTISLFGPQIEFNLADGFPLDPSRQVFLRGDLEELFWMLRGSTNNNELTAKNVNIWTQWAIRQEHVEYTQAERLAMLREKFMQDTGDGAAGQTVYLSTMAEAIDIDKMLDGHGIPKEKYAKEQLAMLFQKLVEKNGSKEIALSHYDAMFKGGVSQEQFNTIMKNYGIPGAPKIGALGPIYGEQWCKWPDPEKDETKFFSVPERVQMAEDYLASGAAEKFTQADLDSVKDQYQQYLDEKSNGATGSTMEELLHDDIDTWGIPNKVTRRTTHNQIAKLIEDLKKRPNSRRHIVSTWNVPYLPDESLSPQQNIMRGKMALAPCHTLFQYYVEGRASMEMCKELTTEQLDEYMQYCRENELEVHAFQSDQRGFIDDPKYWEVIFNFDKKKLVNDWFKERGIKTQKLSCKLYQRSCDLLVGGAFNIAAYAAQTMMVAQCVDMVPGRFIHTFGDVHIYKDHMLPNSDGDSVFTQLEREVRAMPVLLINPEVKDIFAFKYEDFKLTDYNPHKKINYKVAV